MPIPDESVQCIVTSPPYWGLRKYSGEQELVWAGTDGCEHEFSGRDVSDIREETTIGKSRTSDRFYGNESRKFNGNHQKHFQTHTCIHCDAWRGAFGLEPTIEIYIAHTVEVLRECRRVLRSDGVLFWNIGDSYAANRSYQVVDNKHVDVGNNHGSNVPVGLKPKDLCLIPSRVALAAQADGWWVRSMIIWSKPNPMPESVTDRPTDAYEHILMLTKAERYYWDAYAVRENREGNTHSRGSKRTPPIEKAGIGHEDWCKYMVRDDELTSRNLRNVWMFATQPYSEAHFATFPEELPRRCILAATKLGDTVLDPFAGSGTVGRVAVELNRKAILNDLSYHDLSDKRTRNVQRNLLVTS